MRIRIVILMQVTLGVTLDCRVSSVRNLSAYDVSKGEVGVEICFAILAFAYLRNYVSRFIASSSTAGFLWPGLPPLVEMSDSVSLIEMGTDCRGSFACATCCVNMCMHACTAFSAWQYQQEVVFSLQLRERW